ncbi:MAG: hypothetical protein P8M18_07180, partial [Woeseiaceae bacterium]|nr:hypothetical protein [Woeseiaceae bacterium]
MRLLPKRRACKPGTPSHDNDWLAIAGTDHFFGRRFKCDSTRCGYKLALKMLSACGISVSASWEPLPTYFLKVIIYNRNDSHLHYVTLYLVNSTLKLTYLLWLTGISPVLADELGTEPMKRQFTFSCPFIEGNSMEPRGGSTEGQSVTLDRPESNSWQRLHKKGISDIERDRRAILAMAGGYRTSFEFIETIG